MSDFPTENSARIDDHCCRCDGERGWWADTCFLDFDGMSPKQEWVNCPDCVDDDYLPDPPLPDFDDYSEYPW